MTNTDDYAYWRDALAGLNPDVHEGTPQCGFYRTKDGKPVAIWRDEAGALVCKSGHELIDPQNIWTWVAARPVTSDDYNAFMESGHWPDIPVSPDRSNTFGLDDLTRLQSEIEDEARQALAELETRGVPDQQAADYFGNWSNRIAKLGKEAETARKAEKEPHLEAGREIDAKWKPVTGRASDAVKAIKAKLTDYLKAERTRKAREAAEAAEAGEPVKDIKAKAGGAAGRSVGLRTEITAIIKDYDAALTALKDDPDIRDLVQRKANAIVRAGGTLPGTEKHTEEKAA